MIERARLGSDKLLLRRNDAWLEDALCAKIVYCVTSGLCYIHEAGVVHRDVKADNLLMKQWKTVVQRKICYFLEATWRGMDDNDDYIRGTEGY